MNQAHNLEKASVKSILSLCLISTAFNLASPAQGQITPDNTLSSEASVLNQNLIINGALGDKIDGGAIRGSNLFHSFSEFNIQDGQRVYFANPTGIENILTRVTGGNASNIFGTLGVAGAANLFLINPNGILFGENAQLDVQGSFVGTTANGVQFGNQGIFSATNPQAPPLLTIQPSALWFNQLNQSAAIQNNSIAPAGIDSLGVSRFGLGVGDGKSLLLVGGNVSMDGGKLFASAGRVELGGLAAPGNINLVFNGDNLSLKFPLNVTRAEVSLTNQARVFVEGSGGGNIAVNARNVNILGGSGLYAGIGRDLGTPETVAGDITLNATGEIKIAGFGSEISNLVKQGAFGNGGNITIDSGNLSLSDRAGINASTLGVGNAGNVTVRAKNAIFLAGNNDGYGIFSIVVPGAVGNGGNIDINAVTLSLTDGAAIGASTLGVGDAGNVTVRAKNAVFLAGNSGIDSVVGPGAVGKGGNIDINAATLSLTNGAELATFTALASDTEPAGRGDAGNVNVFVTGVVNIAGQKNGIQSGIFSRTSTGGVGNGGNISIYSGDLSLSDNAGLSASTSAVGNAGNVTVSAKNTVSLADARITSLVEAGGIGKGGNIDINAATLSLTDGAQLSTFTSSAFDTEPAGRGDAGNVNVLVTGAVDIAGQKNGFSSGINSAVAFGTVGNGGNITIDSDSLSLRDGAFLAASTFGQGNAGNVTVSTKNAVSLANAGISSLVGAGGIGKGGNIDINAATLALTDGAQISTFTSAAFDTEPAGRGDAGNVNVLVTGAVDIAGQKNGFSSGINSAVAFGTVGNGGNITIDSDSLSLRDGAFLAASTFGQGNAGNVTVSTKNAVFLANDAGIFSAVEVGGNGKGGNIEINSPKISLDNQGELNAESASGNGGNINVNSDLLLLRRNSQISTSAGTEKLGGNGGNINIKSKFIVAVPKENSDITANAFTGTGGNVEINSQGIFGIESRIKPTEKSDITASSELGVTGVTNINTPDTSSIQNSFTKLPPVIDTNALIANSCISRGTKRQENSFTITGSGALTTNRPGVLVSNYTTGEVRGVETTSRPWKKGDPIIEPTGLYRLNNGQLLLSRECSN